MYILKSCPKCHGDLTPEQDAYARALFTRDTDFACLQCGYRLNPRERRTMLQLLRERLAPAA